MSKLWTTLGLSLLMQVFTWPFLQLRLFRYWLTRKPPTAATTATGTATKKCSLVNLKVELGKSGIGGIGIAGKLVADMLGVLFFFLLGRCTVCDQRSAARSTTELIKTRSALTAHRTCCVTAHQPIKTEEERSLTRVRA